MALRYLLDEHLNPVYRFQLVRREPELVVRIIGDLDAPSKGTLDPEILIWCETNGFILVTNNRKSMPCQRLQQKKPIRKKAQKLQPVIVNNWIA